MPTEEFVDGTTKGLWLPGTRLPSSEFVAAGHHVFGGPVSFPLLLLKREALVHNASVMAEYATRHGMRLAPHGKTSMAPALYRMQLDAGAWGITLATANQVAVARDFGLPRILLANELLEPEPLRWLIAERERDRDFKFLCYVDSREGVEALRAALADVPGGRAFSVLVELGYPGGRTGVRGIAEAVALAEAAAAVPRLTVTGVAGYEGLLPTVEDATAYLETLREAATVIGGGRPMLVSAGGSAYFDAVADVLATSKHPVLLRSGCYLTHDDGLYAGHARRIGVDLRPAFELWARVISVPEPGLALAGFGRRDAPFDSGLPSPRTLRRGDATLDATGLRVTGVNDQHAYLDVGAGPTPVPGDLISFGISHPCTAFDKWRVLPVVDEDYRIVDLVHTYF